MKLSENFSLWEFTKSQTALRAGIDNTPSEEVIGNLEYLVTNFLQPLRDMIQSPIVITSGYRSLKLNRRIRNSSRNSQHTKGQAADFEALNLSNIELGKFIENSGLIFDQLIYEYVKENDPHSGWIHASLKKTGKNRQQVIWR